MTHLVVLVHADPSVQPRYQAALDATGLPVELRLLNAGSYSSAYDGLARGLRMHRGSRTLLGAVVDRAGASELGDYASVTLASFSAGYALVRAVLADPPSVEQLDGVVSIDSWHAALDPDGTAADSQLGGLVRWGLLATEGPRICWLAHTDVATPQHGAHAFASTTQVAQELRRLMGLEPGPDDTWRGGLRIHGEDRRESDHDEHVAALTEWGPQWLADAMMDLVEHRLVLALPQPDDPPDTQPGEPLGLRCLRRCREEQLAGVAEVPGAQHSPRILEYLAGCERGGHIIGSALRADEVPWCAAAQGWALAQEVTAAESWPHRWRAAVRELWADALAAGSARGASRVRRGEYLPRVGDLLVLARGGPAIGSGRGAFARTHGQGHVGRIVEVRYDQVRTIDANVADRWTDVTRDLSSPALVGVIAYPQLVADVVVPDDDELEGLLALGPGVLMAAEDAARRGEDGLASSGLAMLL